jgi:hypothetical protein
MLTYIKSTRIERSGDWLRHVLQTYINKFGFSQTPKQAVAAAEEIGRYRKNQKAFRLATAIGKSIINTSHINTTDKMYCQKIAQLALWMIIKEMGAKRDDPATVTGYDSIPVISSRIEEMVDLTLTFSAKLWTNEERKKLLLGYNKLVRIFERDEIGSAENIGLKTLWAWANGDIPDDLTVFRVLRFTKELNTNITNSIADAWQAEEERVEDSQG